MATCDTIFAPASPAQKSGVAVIRISGKKAGDALQSLLQRELPAPRSATLRKVYHPQTRILLDRALILWFPAPASFTGEDVAELHVHGSIAVITSVLEALGKINGLRMAEPGEFSRRAFENNKMDLTEAEGLADLIEAETALQAKQALFQMEGSLHTLYEGWRKNLIEMQARLEAYIDFPDEEIPVSVLDEIELKKASLRDQIKAHLSDNSRGERLRKGLQVVILGAPNAGKSSLLNVLAKRDVAIVSDIAGTTRDVLDVHLDIGGYPVTISDTAGLRSEAETIEQEGIRRALKRAEASDVTLLLLDASTTSETHKALIEQAGEGAIIVYNKSDLPNAIIPAGRLQISAKEQLGIDHLLGTLKERATALMGDGKSNAPIVTRARHRQLLERTQEQLEMCHITGDLVLAAEELRGAAYALGQIIGRIDVEDILDELFSSFCIGK